MRFSSPFGVFPLLGEECCEVKFDWISCISFLKMGEVAVCSRKGMNQHFDTTSIFPFLFWRRRNGACWHLAAGGRHAIVYCITPFVAQK